MHLRWMDDVLRGEKNGVCICEEVALSVLFDFIIIVWNITNHSLFTCLYWKVLFLLKFLVEPAYFLFCSENIFSTVFLYSLPLYSYISLCVFSSTINYLLVLAGWWLPRSKSSDKFSKCYQYTRWAVVLFIMVMDSLVCVILRLLLLFN